VPDAQKLSKVSYEEMLEMASLGAKVLQTRSVEMAMKRGVTVQVLSSFLDPIGSDLPGTLVTKEEEIMEAHVVNGITYTDDEAKITLLGVPDIPGMSAKIFGPLSEANINVDMIVQNISSDHEKTDMTFTVPIGDLEKVEGVLRTDDALKDIDVRAAKDVCKISVVGIGMRSHAGVAQTMFKALADKGINIQVISTSEIKISVLVSSDYKELALRALHTAYGLDKE
jgi:aspartate kinase